MKTSKNILEFRRQLAHIFFGVIILWGIHFDLLYPFSLFVFLCIISVILFAIKKGIHVPVFFPVLRYFERKDHLHRFPGRGLFFYLLGALMCMLLYKQKVIVMASLSILLLGDAVSNLAGRHLGKIPHFLNKDKTVEGTLAGIIVSTAVCSLFFPFYPSLLASTVGMIAEIPRIQFWNIPLDDNVSIPVSAGAVLMFFI
ncbi:hypothetical protein COB57_05835 [Candidatus Peregrinibacteria bacterium]|nr:MAG: hypothetical protein COB57_05835 [Candidatus Peregrinibacteria bacterium]